MRSLPLFAASLLLPLAAFAADAPATDPKAEEILTAFAQFYTGVKSFQTRIDTTMKIDAKGRKTEAGMIYDLSVARPDSLALTLIEGKMGGTIITDGKTQTIYLPVLKRYTSGPAPKSLDALLPPVLQSMVLQGLPFGYESLLTPDIAADLRKNASSITLTGPAEVNGIPAQQLKFESPQFIAHFWIATGDKPLLLKTEIALNIAALPESVARQQQLNEFRRTTHYTDWKIDQPIPAATFQFQPPAGAEKVDTLFPQGASPAAEKPNPLIGKPAPAFTLKDLTGQDIALSSLRGKTVVLDFWATWCPPCVRGLPIVSTVTSAFKDKGVVFYAINAREDIPTITAFLKSQSLDIPVLLDSDGAAMKLYGVNGIPQSFIIDPEGIIRAAHTGFTPALEKNLTEELTTLSSGGTLPAAK